MEVYKILWQTQKHSLIPSLQDAQSCSRICPPARAVWGGKCSWMPDAECPVLTVLVSAGTHGRLVFSRENALLRTLMRALSLAFAAFLWDCLPSFPFFVCCLLLLAAARGCLVFAFRLSSMLNSSSESSRECVSMWVIDSSWRSSGSLTEPVDISTAPASEFQWYMIFSVLAVDSKQQVQP